MKIPSIIIAAVLAAISAQASAEMSDKELTDAIVSYSVIESKDGHSPFRVVLHSFHSSVRRQLPAPLRCFDDGGRERDGPDGRNGL